MKIDVTKHLTLGAKRTLKAFRVAMFDALSEKDFDRITVNDICKKSEYPRATFYNYFDDKLDLLEYLWSYIVKIFWIKYLVLNIIKITSSKYLIYW